LINKYGNVGNNITEVIEEYTGQSQRTPPDTRKPEKKKLIMTPKPLER